mgnify:CR=1 FL=1
MKRFLKMAKFLIIMILIVFVLSEIILNIYIIYFASNKQLEEIASIRQLIFLMNKHKTRFSLSPHPYTQFISAPNYVDGCNQHNSVGMRGGEITEKKDGEIWIACLGESTTYDCYVGCWENSYPAQLEKALNNRGIKAKVLNAGVNGWTSFEILIDYELRVCKYPIDYVIYYGGLNDITLTRMVYPVPKNYRELDISQVRGGMDIALSYPFWENSAVLRILGVKFFGKSTHYDLFISQPKEINRLKEFMLQLVSGKYPDGIFKQAPIEKILSMNPPVWFENNIRNIIYVSRGRGIKPVLLSYIFYNSRDYDKNSQISIPAELDKFLDVLSVGVEEMNKKLYEVSQQENVPFYDLQSEYPREREFFNDFIHNSDKGAELKAQLVCEYLIKEVLPSP